MRIYHGSLEKVENPEIRVPNRTLDYGSGFYATTSYEQALGFDNPTEEWVDFVMKNRTDRNFVHNYDIVYGPVANDRVYFQFALYEGNLISKQTLINELKTYKLVDQYLFHTGRALQALSFVESEKVMQL